MDALVQAHRTDIASLLEFAKRMDASDLHLTVGVPPTLRVHGKLVPVPGTQPLSRDEVHDMVYDVLTDAQKAKLEERLDLDFSLELEGLGRFRVNVFFHRLGEGAVFRLIPSRIKSIEELGLPGVLEDLSMRERGLILVTGPTGSGKSTTLSVLLRHIASPEKEILTIEDPVEYHIPHAHQVQVNEKAGLTFARALRSFLRHDPDIIMVGEIRDQETAEIATRAAMTGHLVFSTVHTNDAPSAPARLVDMGVEPFLIASSLTAAIAQRLVRRVCPNCASRVPVDPNLAAALEGACPAYQMRGAGCDQCAGTGYRRRAPIWEVLAVTPEVRALINRGADANAIRDVARKQGMTTLIEDGLRLVRQGVTTVEEVIRVASSEGLAGEAVQ
jgi:pilus retraction protein PilT